MLAAFAKALILIFSMYMEAQQAAITPVLKDLTHSLTFMGFCMHVLHRINSNT